MADTKGWGAKAASLYDGAYAARYRSHDDSLVESAAYRAFVVWLQQVCDRWASPFDAPRSWDVAPAATFCALRGIPALSVSTPHRRCSCRRDIRCTRIDHRRRDHAGQGRSWLAQDFGADRVRSRLFHRVLAEHVPLQPALVASVARCSAPADALRFQPCTQVGFGASRVGEASWLFAGPAPAGAVQRGAARTPCWPAASMPMSAVARAARGGFAIESLEGG
jgi:hypothetical protein